MDIHEATSYAVKAQDGESCEGTPESGLREGCPTSPVLFNIFHETVMTTAIKEREKEGKPGRSQMEMEP